MERLVLPAMKKNHIPVRIGGYSEFFSGVPSDGDVRVELLDKLNRWQQPTLLITKSDQLLRPEWFRHLDAQTMVVQISFSTLNQEWAQQVESGAPGPDERLQVCAQLVRHGFKVVARIDPLFSQEIHPAFIGRKELSRIRDIGVKDVLVGQAHLDGVQARRLRELAGGKEFVPGEVVQLPVLCEEAKTLGMSLASCPLSDPARLSVKDKSMNQACPAWAVCGQGMEGVSSSLVTLELLRLYAKTVHSPMRRVALKLLEYMIRNTDRS